MSLIELNESELQAVLDALNNQINGVRDDVDNQAATIAAYAQLLATHSDAINALNARVTALESEPTPLPREQLLAWLSSLSGHVVSGQHVSHSLSIFLERYETHITALVAQTGYYVGMLGVSLVGLTASTAAYTAPIMIDYANRGGLVQVDYHMPSPFTGGSYNDLTNRNLVELLNPTTDYYRAANARYMDMLDQVADLFATMRDAGVVVLWRPFHEMNYSGAFWWDWGCHDGNVVPYGQLWRHMHDYFTRVRHLDNLLWVYAPANLDSTRAVEWMFPGSDVVDIVGLSLYSYGHYPVAVARPDLGDGQNNYTRMLEFGKPFALTECGPRVWTTPYDNVDLIAAIKENFPQAVYFMRWHSWYGNPVAIVDNSNAAGLLGDSWVINRPAFYVS